MSKKRKLVPSKVAGRGFYEHHGVILQEPAKAIFYVQTINRGGFRILLRVEVLLEHGFKGGGDIGVDVFWVTLGAEDRERKDIGRKHHSKCVHQRRFEVLPNLLAWLRSVHLEESFRVGIVHHPPAPEPSQHRNLARALFQFADEIEACAESLRLDKEVRASMCPWRKKNESHQ